MMTGLPGDTNEKSKATARKIVALGASCTRIYPTLVIKNTELEQLWLSGKYKPQTLDEAVNLTAELLTIFKEGGVKVIRVGLHPSEDLIKGNDMLAGPFHVSFRQLAETELWRRELQKLINNRPEGGNIVVKIPNNELNEAIGFNGSNRAMLEKHFTKVVFEVMKPENENKPIIIVDKRTPLPAKNVIKQIGILTLIESEPTVYKAIAGHPDIFICQGSDAVVVSPSLPQSIIHQLELRNYKIYERNCCSR
jgi:histone acetyltransferase (RNA polymerase elongator complex component)